MKLAAKLIVLVVQTVIVIVVVRAIAPKKK